MRCGDVQAALNFALTQLINLTHRHFFRLPSISLALRFDILRVDILARGQFDQRLLIDFLELNFASVKMNMSVTRTGK